MQKSRLTILLVIITVLAIVGTVFGLTGAFFGPKETFEEENNTTGPPVTSNDNVPPGSAVHDLPVPEAVANARQAVATKEGVAIKQVIILKVEEIDWPDSCLGISEPNLFCAQVITPGYRIIIRGTKDYYEYRTNKDGTQVVLVRQGTEVQAEAGEE